MKKAIRMTRERLPSVTSAVSVLTPAALVALALAMDVPPAKFSNLGAALVQLAALFFGPYLLCSAIAYFTGANKWGVLALAPILALESAVFSVAHRLQPTVDVLFELLSAFTYFTVIWAIALSILGMVVILAVVIVRSGFELTKGLFRPRATDD